MIRSRAECLPPTMTYCVGLRLDAGLVLVSDSRTSASVDDISVYSKMHHFRTAPDRLVVLLSAGNLATTQAVRNQVLRDLANPDAAQNLNSLAHLDEIAAYIGEINREIQHNAAPSADQASGYNPEATFLLGGQVGDNPHDMFLIYPQGNYIAASRQKPFLQVGETKYGKPILDRLASPGMSLARGSRLLLVSMDASMRSNLSVGPPVEVAVCKAGTHTVNQHMKLQAGDDYLDRLSGAWAAGLQDVFEQLPSFEWEQ